MNHGEKLGKLIFLERGLEKESTNQKSLNLDQDLRRKHQVTKRKISKIENHETPKLK